MKIQVEGNTDQFYQCQIAFTKPGYNRVQSGRNSKPVTSISDSNPVPVVVQYVGVGLEIRVRAWEDGSNLWDRSGLGTWEAWELAHV
jgi:hypothetical protein